MRMADILDLTAIWTAVPDAWAWLMRAGGVELRSQGLGSIALRLGLAMVFGGILGFERERRDRPAGLRTHILISIASAMFALVALEFLALPTSEEERLRIDPIRLIEAVTSGVAFLAAGSIIVAGGHVKGVTTGAGMWLAGAIGLACGLGYFQIAGLGTGFALVVLTLLRRLETLLAVKRPRGEHRRTGTDEAP